MTLPAEPAGDLEPIRVGARNYEFSEAVLHSASPQPRGASETGGDAPPAAASRNLQIFNMTLTLLDTTRHEGRRRRRSRPACRSGTRLLSARCAASVRHIRNTAHDPAPSHSSRRQHSQRGDRGSRKRRTRPPPAPGPTNRAKRGGAAAAAAAAAACVGGGSPPRHTDLLNVAPTPALQELLVLRPPCRSARAK